MPKAAQKNIAGRRREKTVQVRLTAAERRLVTKFAERRGESVSGSLRRLLREACAKEGLS